MMSNNQSKTFIARIAAQKNYQLRLDMERAALFGKYAGTNASGKEYYQTEGLISSLAVVKLVMSLVHSLLVYLRKLLVYVLSMSQVTKQRLCFLVVKQGCNQCTLHGRINVETIGDIKEQVGTIQIGTGKFIIMQHPLMNAASGYEARSRCWSGYENLLPFRCWSQWFYIRW